MNGRKPVLFDRALKPEWIDFALERFLASKNEAELRSTLQQWLATKGYGAYTVQKTALQLQRTVGYRTSLDRERLASDLKRMSELAPDERGLIRLKLLVDANQFFADCVHAIKLLHLNGSPSVSLSQLYERLQAQYGHRGMIPRRVRYVLQTLAAFGCLENRNHAWWIVAGSGISDL